MDRIAQILPFEGLHVFGTSVSLNDVRPLPLVVLLALVVGWLSVRSRAGISRRIQISSAILRLLGVLCLGLAVSGISIQQRDTRQRTAVVLDVSDSMDEASIRRGISWIHDLQQHKAEGDDVRVVVFGARAQEVTRELHKDAIEALRERVGPTGSNIARAIELGQALVRGGESLGRVVLLSDGRGASGNLAQGRSEPQVYFARVEPEGRADVAIEELTLPAEVRAGEPFRFQVQVSSTGPARARLEIHLGAGEGPPLVRELELSSGDTTVSLETTLNQEGERQLEAVTEPGGADAFSTNNRREAVISVLGPPRVLVIDPVPSSVSALVRALSVQKFQVEARRPSELPQSAIELEKNALILLSDVARADLGAGAEALLINYVRGGGALLFSGGERSYGAGGFEGSPLEGILPFVIGGEDENQRASVAMALVVDRSGSMQGEPLEMAKAACLATLSLLEPKDQLEVVAFDARPVRVVPMQGARRAERIGMDLSRLESGGGTELFPALDMAYQDLLGVEAKKKHIVLLTDGNADSEGLAELASAALADGITLTTVGFGASVHEVLLRSLADLGGGRFHRAREARVLPRIFARETELMTLEENLHDLLTIRVEAPRPWLKGIPFGSAPPLLGAAKLRLRPPLAQLILGLDNGYPLLAEMRVGLGVTLGWASDLKPNYAEHFLGWSHLPRFLAQLIRAHQRSQGEELWPMTTELDGDDVVVSFDAPALEFGFNNGLKSRLFVKDGAPNSPEIEHAFSWVLPGRYSSRSSAPRQGVYRLRAEHRDEQGTLMGTSALSVVRPYPDEYRKVRPDVADGPLSDLPRVQRPEQVLQPDTSRQKRVFLGTWCLWGAALLLVAEVALRRMAGAGHSKNS